MAALEDQLPAPVERLTNPQREALRLVHSHTIKEMARDLDISPEAVKRRLEGARAKLQVTSSRRAAQILARYEETQGLAERPAPSGHLDVTAAPELSSKSERKHPAPRISFSAMSDETRVPGLSAWTWDELETDLLALAQTPHSRLMVSHLVEGCAGKRAFLTKAGVAREVATIIFAVVDPFFREEEPIMT